MIPHGKDKIYPNEQIIGNSTDVRDLETFGSKVYDRPEVRRRKNWTTVSENGS